MDKMGGKVLRRDQQQASVAPDTQRRAMRLRDILTTLLSFVFMRGYPGSTISGREYRALTAFRQ
jgi:hypothetical protein